MKKMECLRCRVLISFFPIQKKELFKPVEGCPAGAGTLFECMLLQIGYAAGVKNIIISILHL
jgi:hypothetical protein